MKTFVEFTLVLVGYNLCKLVNGTGSPEASVMLTAIAVCSYLLARRAARLPC